MFVYLFSNNNKRIFCSFDIRKRFTARHSDFKWRNFELSRPCVHVMPVRLRNKENVGFSLVRYPWIIVIKRSFKWNNFELLIGHVQTRNFLKIRRVKKKKLDFRITSSYLAHSFVFHETSRTKQIDSRAHFLAFRERSVIARCAPLARAWRFNAPLYLIHTIPRHKLFM